MARRYDIAATLGDDFEFELTPDVLAYEISMEYSSQIVRRCSEVGITLTELAKRMNTSVSTLSEKLNGQNLTLKSVAALAIAVGCDVEAPALVPIVPAVSTSDAPLLQSAVMSDAHVPVIDGEWSSCEAESPTNALMGGYPRYVRSNLYANGSRFEEAA